MHNVFVVLSYSSDGVRRTPKRCLKYDSTRNFHYQTENIDLKLKLQASAGSPAVFRIQVMLFCLP